MNASVANSLCKRGHIFWSWKRLRPIRVDVTSSQFDIEFQLCGGWAIVTLLGIAAEKCWSVCMVGSDPVPPSMSWCLTATRGCCNFNIMAGMSSSYGAEEAGSPVTLGAISASESTHRERGQRTTRTGTGESASTRWLSLPSRSLPMPLRP